MRFVDTNVLLYAISTDASERTKSALADELLSQQDLALSTQVLQEFYVQATRTTREHRLTHAHAVDLVTSFGRFPIQATTPELVHAAMATRARFDVSYWDAAIIEAARSLGCSEVLSEDLSHGQDYGGVVVTNPFR
ncbi:PIN domain-containing protein [soil metagenome]